MGARHPYRVKESAVRENKLKSIWARGEAVVNGWLSIPSAFSAEVMSHQGFDSLTIDMQHGVVDYQVAVTMLQGISTTGVVPLARVPWNDPARIMKILDAGAYGVICPMINTAQEAEAMVRGRTEPPRRVRGRGRAGDRAAAWAGVRGDGAGRQRPAARLPELGPGARLALRGNRLRGPRQRRDHRDADDRARGGPQEPGRDPERGRGRRDLRGPLRPQPGHGPQAPPRPDRPAGGGRPEEDRGGLQAPQRGRGDPQRHRGLLAQDDRGGLPVRHARERQPAHGRQGR